MVDDLVGVNSHITTIIPSLAESRHLPGQGLQLRLPPTRLGRIWPTSEEQIGMLMAVSV